MYSDYTTPCYIPVGDDFALIDWEDYELMSKWTWRLSSGYAITGHPSQLMHRMIMLPSPSELVDHKNWDRLDNRRSNLRIATVRQNAWNRGLNKNNRSGSIGVRWVPSRKSWNARFHRDGKTVFCRYYRTKKEAEDAYRTVLDLHAGEFAAHHNISTT